MRFGRRSIVRWRWAFTRRISTATWDRSSPRPRSSQRSPRSPTTYHLPFLALRGIAGGTTLQPPLSDKDIVLDAVVIANEKTPRDRWKEFYLGAIKILKPGLSEMIVHLGHDDAELQAVTVDHEPYGSAWRQRDYSIVNDPDFKRALVDNQVVVIEWRDLQKLVNEP